MRESESNRLPGIARCGREREQCIACRVLGQSNIMQPFVLTRDALWKTDAAERADGLTVTAVGVRSRVFRGGTRYVLGHP